MNKYNKWYQDITDRAKNRKLNSYTESHHIRPRSLGGTDESSNLVALTAREHFICHWLLVKITTGKDRHKMLNALRMMRAEKSGQERYNTKITARVYESIKQEYAELQSKQFIGKGNGFYGKTHTEEARQKISEANKGRVQPLEEKEKQKAAWAARRDQGLKRAGYSEEFKKERSKNTLEKVIQIMVKLIQKKHEINNEPKQLAVHSQQRQYKRRPMLFAAASVKQNYVHIVIGQWQSTAMPAGTVPPVPA